MKHHRMFLNRFRQKNKLRHVLIKIWLQNKINQEKISHFREKLSRITQISVYN